MDERECEGCRRRWVGGKRNISLWWSGVRGMSMDERECEGCCRR